MAMALALGAVMLYESDIGWYIWYVGGGGLIDIVIVDALLSSTRVFVACILIRSSQSSR